MPRIDKGPGLSSSGGTISGPLTITGAFTSPGIDDNATAERLQITDTEITLGTSGGNYGVINAVNDQSTAISGGDTETTGGNIIFFGGAHATQANDIEFRSGATLKAFYDDSTSTWDFQNNKIMIDTPTATTETILTIIDANSLTTGRIARFSSNSSDTSARELLFIHNDNPLATGAKCMRLKQDAAERMIVLDHDATAAGSSYIDFQGTSAANTTNPISSLTTSGAVQGHIQIEVNGTKRWLAFLANPS